MSTLNFKRFCKRKSAAGLSRSRQRFCVLLKVSCFMQLRLFKSNFCSLSFQFCFDVFCFCFGCTLFNNLRSAVNNSLSLFQTQSGYFTNNFDNFNFVCSNFCQLNVKLIFLLSCLSCAACCCYNNTCCCRYTKLFFTCFY